jgi:RNA recognition motif-containing protein
MQIMELFRQFAVVKSAQIIRDSHTGVSKGFAFVEFHSIDHASYALQCSKDLKFDSNTVKVAFAREKVMQQMIAQVQICVLKSLMVS